MENEPKTIPTQKMLKRLVHLLVMIALVIAFRIGDGILFS